MMRESMLRAFAVHRDRQAAADEIQRLHWRLHYQLGDEWAEQLIASLLQQAATSDKSYIELLRAAERTCASAVNEGRA
jgi:hypothetical protein